MKKFLLFVFLVSFFAMPLYSQIETIWTMTLGTSQSDIGNYIQPTSDGGFIIVGTAGDSSTDILLIKTDSVGNEVWSKTFGGSYDDEGYKARETSDGGFILIGKYVPDNDSTATNAYLVKTNSSGDSLWTKKFSFYSYFHDDISFDVVELEDSSYTIMIDTYDTLDELFGKLVNVNKYGEINWEKELNFYNDFVDFSLIQNENKEYLILSHRLDRLSSLLIKTDSLGNEIWYKNFDSYNSHPDCIANSIIENSNSNYIIVGSGHQHIWATELNNNGDSLWFKHYDIDEATVSSVFQQSDGGYLLGSSILYNVYGIKIDEDGDAVWENRISGVQEISSMCAINSKEYAILSASGNDLNLTKIKVNSTLVNIEGDSLWIDDDWDGFATGTLDGSSSYDSDSLAITEYKWIVDNTVVGTTAQIEIELPIGVNIVTLEITNGNGGTVSKDFQVNVYSYKMETNGPISASVSTIGDSLFFIASKDDRIYCFSDDDEEDWFLLTGGDLQSTTTIGPDNNIYVGSDDTRLYSFGIDGNFVWDKPMGGVVSSSPSITPQGTLYVGTSGERLYSINCADGQTNWNYLAGGAISSSPSVSASDDVFFGCDNGVFYCVNAQGSLKWSYETDDAIKSSPAIDDSGNVYFGSNDSYLYALSPAGSLLWRFQTGGAVVSSPAIDSDGNIYFGSEDGFFYCVSPSGVTQWQYYAKTPVDGSPTISQLSDLESDWRVYFGCSDGKFVALSLDGELAWYYETGDNITASPLVTDAGRIYIGSTDNSVYGFAEYAFTFLTNKVSSNTSHTPQWATFQKDNKRTGYAENVITDVKDNEVNNLPTQYSLMQNYPNPFNPTTTIQFELPEKSDVVLDVFNILGEKVATLINEEMSAGAKKVVFNAAGLSSGVYFYRLKAGNFVEVKKLTLLR